MPNTGNVFPATAENVTRAGATVWSNPANAVSDNALDATCNAGSSGSQYLVCRNFPMPAGVGVPLGITVRVELSEHSGGNETISLRLQDASGALVGSTKTFVSSGTGKIVYTVGGIADLWGATLTQAIVNNATFGVRIWFLTSHDVRIDYVTLAVEYVPTSVTVALGGVLVNGAAEPVAAVVGAPPESGGIFPGPIFPGGVFPGPIFPGTGPPTGDVSVALTSVVMEARAGTLVAAFGYFVALTGVSAFLGSGTTESGGIFPPGIFPPGVFPDPIFPGSGSGATPLGGVGIVIPATAALPLAVLVNVNGGFVSAGADKVATLSGVVVNAAAGTVAVLDRSFGLTGARANATAGLVTRHLTLSGVAANVSVQPLVSTRTLASPLLGVAANAAAGQAGIFNIFPLSGAVATAAAGFLPAGTDKIVSTTGVLVNATAGSLQTVLPGVQVNVSAGTVVASQALVLAGAVANATAGSLSPDKSLTLTGVLVNAAAGTLRTAQGLTGVGVTATVGLLGNAHAAVTQRPPSTASAGLVGIGIPTDVTLALTGAVANATAGTVAVLERNLTGVAANTIAGTVTAVGDRNQALNGVLVNAIAYYVTTGNDIVTPLTVGAVSAAAGAILDPDTLIPLNGQQVVASATAGLVSAGVDKNSSLTGVGITAAAGLVHRDALALTGVGVEARTGSTVRTDIQKTLPAVVATASAGFAAKQNDAIVQLIGVSAVAEAGLMSVGPPVTFGTNRHTGIRPARKNAKDMARLDREMELVED